MSGPIGVLVMGHGTPATSSEIAAFYTRIRHGRPPSSEQLAELVSRYEAIGGVSPLAALTAAQVGGLAERLESKAPGQYVVRYGAKHTDPSLEQAVSELVRCDPTGVVALVLTPHRSVRGSEEYLQRAALALAQAAPTLPLVKIEHWFDAPGLADLWARRVRLTLAEVGGDTVVVFSAHAVPQPEAPDDDPYQSQVEQTAHMVARAAGLEVAGIPWRVAWQSAGRTGQRWCGPGLLATLDQLATSGARAVVVCPIGFVSDHLEILYDLDIEARQQAESAGLAFARSASLNADPVFLGILAEVVSGAAAPLLAR